MTLTNRILAALLALVLLLGGLLAATEIVLALLGRQPLLIPHQDWSAWLSEQTWESATVRSILVGVLILGLLLILVAVRRGKPALLPLPSERDPGVRVTASRRGVEKSIAEVARGVDGVTAASASASRRRITVTASATKPTSRLAEQVRSAVADRLTALGLAQSLRPRVRLSRREAR